MAEQTQKEVKTFSVEQAQKALVYLRPILEELREQFREFNELREQLGRTEGPRGKAREDAIDRLEVVKGLLVNGSDEVEQVGVQVKSFDEGLIDFPYRRSNGKIALLCFKLGENLITHWHDEEGGFAARQPLATLD